MSACPACFRQNQDSPQIVDGHSILRCRSCGHRVIRFRSLSSKATEPGDLHAEIESESFLSSLLRTRTRQSDLLISHLVEIAPNPKSPLIAIDFGCGRGILIERILASNYSHDRLKVIGVDNSEIALSNAIKIGARAFRSSLDYPKTLAPLIEELDSDPNTAIDIFAMDVIEHFESTDIAKDLRELTRFKNLRFLIIKVPVSDGVLHRTAFLLSQLGFAGPLLSLLLSDSAFPHRNIFSIESVLSATRRAGFEIIRRIDDADFEFETLGDRAVRLTSRTPRWFQGLFRGMMNLIGHLLRLNPWCDSVILILKRVDP